MSGRLIGVVGPSGVGKDSVMQALTEASARFRLVRRVITRAPGLGGETYTPVSPETFAQMQADGAFCLDWQAHGLHYGIPTEVQTQIAGGADLLVNLSRSVLAEAHARFDRFEALNITASEDTLARRLADRGRESASDMAARLTRQPAALPAHVKITTLSNDGPIADTVAQALAALTVPETPEELDA